jgi:hypothetical protein
MLYLADIEKVLRDRMPKPRKLAIASKLDATLVLTRDEALALDLYLENQYIHYDNSQMHSVATKISKFCIQLFEDIPNDSQAPQENPSTATADSGNQKNSESR